jgi:hypothetical protein
VIRTPPSIRVDSPVGCGRGTRRRACEYTSGRDPLPRAYTGGCVTPTPTTAELTVSSRLTPATTCVTFGCRVLHPAPSETEVVADG